MILLRRANARGFSDQGWLRSWHTFSFADYYDPAETGWGPLRAINEDVIAPDGGFGKHTHRDMEIITYLLAGTLEHEDSMGNGSVLRHPEVQRISAGLGIQHSESNASSQDEVHLLQIWIEPDILGINPEYEQKVFPDIDKRNRWRLLASPDGADGSLTIYQNARIHASLLTPGETLDYTLAAHRRAYLHVVRGNLTLNAFRLATGDGARIAKEGKLSISATSESEMLLFDLP